MEALHRPRHVPYAAECVWACDAAQHRGCCKNSRLVVALWQEHTCCRELEQVMELQMERRLMEHMDQWLDALLQRLETALLQALPLALPLNHLKTTAPTPDQNHSAQP
ncbi:hypothetical protein J4Q44_G00279980 [Coregonus suidteri]|uniref:Uncharacterized protein n=1 Tax=Coregonus suidteri TaxID=861788 RepID=A0AAN8LA67_9TELE